MKIENQNENLDEQISKITDCFDALIETFERLTLMLNDSEKEYYLATIVIPAKWLLEKALDQPMTTDQKIRLLTAELSINRLEELLS